MELRERELVGGERDGGVCEARGVRWIAGSLSLCRVFDVSHDPAVTVARLNGGLQIAFGVRIFLGWRRDRRLVVVRGVGVLRG